jgi:hypothetical protein
MKIPLDNIAQLGKDKLPLNSKPICVIMFVMKIEPLIL